MKTKKIVKFPRLVAACAVLALLFTVSTAAYAADIGGIRRSIQLWIHGDQTHAILVANDGSYDLYYTDKNGEGRLQQGGGKAFDIFGRERPLTEEELLEYLRAPEVEYREDGSVWVYYFDQSLDITDKFDADGVCYVKLIANGKTVYLTVKYDNGYAYGSHAYISPKSFN